MTPMCTERLILRNWEDRDRVLFHRINSDDAVMKFFGFRRTRAGADAFMDRMTHDISSRGFGFCAVEIAETGETIGFVGLNPAALEGILPDYAIEIGWRLAPEYWGNGYATEAARAWLGFAFRTLGLDEVYSFAVRDNVRSIAVMERIGLVRDLDGDFDHPRVAEPSLKPHVLYRLSRAEWRNRPDAETPPQKGGA
jgi:RimJ/RimL family protein N-acetyltransferase